VPQEPTVRWEHPETRSSSDLDLTVTLVFQVDLVLEERVETSDLPDHQDPPVLTESPETATPADPVEVDTEETQDAQEHLVLRESAEMLEQMV